MCIMNFPCGSAGRDSTCNTGDLGLVAGSNFQHSGEALGLIRIQAAGNRGDDPLIVHLFAVLAATEVQGIQALLLVDHLSQTRSDGLHQAALTVPAGLFVGSSDNSFLSVRQEPSFGPWKGSSFLQQEDLKDLWFCRDV